jgi:hypothetical protein
MIEDQVEAISGDIDRTRDRIGTVATSLDRAVLDPVRQITAVMIGLRRAIDFFVSRKPRRTVEEEPDGDDVGSP